MEIECIERDKAIELVIAAPKLYGYSDEGRKLTDVYDVLANMPAADVVEVVRCKDCKHWETEWSPNNAQFGEHFCPFIGINTAPDWFCADGQRREK